MKLYSLILAGIIFHLSIGIKIKLELQSNILKVGYGINYKYEGMLAHLIDRFYIVTKFILPSIGDIKFSRLNYDNTCACVNKEYAPKTDSRNLEVSWYSLEQYIGFVVRQAFKYCCSLHQV